MALYVGVGKADITNRDNGLYMQGFADERQTTEGVEETLYSRAFIVAEAKSSGKRVVIVVADMWAGTQKVKKEVLFRLWKDPELKKLYSFSNVLVSGTHTHSAPGGYTDYKLYNPVIGFILKEHYFCQKTFDCYVSGIVESIKKAHESLAEGRVYSHSTQIGAKDYFGGNRSYLAHVANPKGQLVRQGAHGYLPGPNEWPTSHDVIMDVLKFVHTSKDDKGTVVERPVGLLSWYPIHPADRGQFNRKVCGDNKGWASKLSEEKAKQDLKIDNFIAAYANSMCGDVSGNMFTVFEARRPESQEGQRAQMKKHGEIQHNTAWKAGMVYKHRKDEELTGAIDYRHRHVDMSDVTIDMSKVTPAGTFDAGEQKQRTWPAALGLSFAAGSTEDGVAHPAAEPEPVWEGIVRSDVDEFGTAQLLREEVKVAMRVAFGPLLPDHPDGFDEGHWPKPIVLPVGLFDPPLATSVLPLQLFKIGTFFIAGIPGEITTMAGRQLRRFLHEEIQGEARPGTVVLSTYANEYSQYITTRFEYDKQHYEGASTLFGPYTFYAYEQEFGKLARSLGEAVIEPWGEGAKKKHSLAPGEQLNPEESIWSENGVYELKYQADGNLVLYGSQTPWSAKTNISSRPACVCIMQNDGNLVVYDVFGKPVWASKTNSPENAGSTLLLGDDGKLKLERPGGTKVNVLP